jgi:hypothetical protein
MTSIILIVFFTAGVIGLKKKIFGALSGCCLVLVLYFFFEDFKIRTFIATVILGFSASFAGSYSIPCFFSGFKGGKHSTGPSYIGGGACKGWGGVSIPAELSCRMKNVKISGNDKVCTARTP